MKKTTLIATAALLALGVLNGCTPDGIDPDTFQNPTDTGGYNDTLKLTKVNQTDLKLTWVKHGSAYADVAYSDHMDTDNNAKVLMHSTKEGTHTTTCNLAETRSREVQYDCHGMEPLILEKGKKYDFFVWYDLGEHKEYQASVVYDDGELVIQ